MTLFSPPLGQLGVSTEVLLVFRPPSTANLVAGNKITFDDSVDGALDPQTLGDGLGSDDPIPAGTYFAQGNNSIGEVDPVNGLGLFNGLVLVDPADNWTFRVFDIAAGNTGTMESVELTIECAE